MTKAELRKKAFEVAAGLINAMDLDAFWGEEVCDGHDEAALTDYQGKVVQYLREKERAFK